MTNSSQSSHQAGEQWFDPKGIPMVFVPAGEFLMGSTEQQVEEAFAQAKREYPDARKEWFTNELPQHRQVIDKAFWLDLTPVTNMAYARFVADGGYHNPDLWTPEGWQWRQQKKKNAPDDFKDFLKPQQPRINVAWYEADAYCRWRGGRLPTEMEWEWAARGRGNWIYPWGNIFIDDFVIYTYRKHGRKTAVVGDGIRMNGASWVGALDMAGNVWEWCSSVYQSYPYQLHKDSNIENSIERVIRGGSWSNDSSSLRTANRQRLAPDKEDITFGFRCVRSL